MNSKDNNGFTLLEVLVALIIVATALIAAVRLTGMAVRHTVTLEQKTIAEWVAQNLITERRLGLSSPSLKKGDVEMADRRWYWQWTETEGPYKLRRHELVVSLDEKPLENSIISMTLYQGTREAANLAAAGQSTQDPPPAAGGGEPPPAGGLP